MKENQNTKSINFIDQVFYFNIILQIIIPINIIIAIIIIGIHSEQKEHISNLVDRLGIFLILLFITSPISFFKCYKSKKILDIFLLFPTITLMFLCFFGLYPDADKNTFLLILGRTILGVGFIAYLFSIYYFFKYNDHKKFFIVAAILLSIFAIAGLNTLLILLIQIGAIISILFCFFYISYRIFKDNYRLILNIFKIRDYKVFTISFVKFSPFLLIAFIGFILNGVINDKLITPTIEKAASASEYMPEKVFDECKVLTCFINPVNLIADQVNSFVGMIKNSVKKSSDFFLILFISLLKFLGIIANMLLLFALIKSFSYIFSRVALSVKYGLPATLNDDFSEKPDQGNIRNFGEEYSISSNDKQVYYAVSTMEPNGAIPAIDCPQPTSSPFARIFCNGLNILFSPNAYFMNKISTQGEGKNIDFTTTQGKCFIEWDLKNDEEIIFHYKNLVLFSESVKLSTLITFKITSTIFGRFSYACAKGPGKIVLLTKGKAKIYHGLDAPSIPIKNAVAWQKNMLFDSKSNLDIQNIFFRGVYFQPSSKNSIIIDSDERGRAESGASHFIFKFLIPFP